VLATSDNAIGRVVCMSNPVGSLVRRSSSDAIADPAASAVALRLRPLESDFINDPKWNDASRKITKHIASHSQDTFNKQHYVISQKRTSWRFAGDKGISRQVGR
jgi:hypothetical protein